MSLNCWAKQWKDNKAKELMQGKLIAVRYTLRTYWNQFSLGGLCKQEKMHQCSFSIRGFNFDNFENSHNSFLWPKYFIDYFCENGFHVRLWHPSCVYFSPKVNGQCCYLFLDKYTKCLTSILWVKNLYIKFGLSVCLSVCIQ